MNQTWNPRSYESNARFVSQLGAPVLDWLDPQPGQRVLDLGCGDGALTARLVEAGCVVVGIDASPELVAAAISRGINATTGDGARLEFDGEFDAVFSNAALHWMTDAPAVAAGVARALRPGGRFVAEMGGAGNVASIVLALEHALARRQLDGAKVNPWYFPSAQEYGDLLEKHGFSVDRMELFSRPTPLPGDVLGWLETFAQEFAGIVPRADRPAFYREVRDELRPLLAYDSGIWTADYVRLRFAATLRGVAH